MVRFEYVSLWRSGVIVEYNRCAIDKLKVVIEKIHPSLGYRTWIPFRLHYHCWRFAYSQVVDVRSALLFWAKKKHDCILPSIQTHIDEA